MTEVETGSQFNQNSVNIQKLFDFKRFDKPLDLIIFLVYFPLGLCLLIIRVFIGLHALLVASLLPKKSSIRCFILRTMCGVLGIVVKEESASIEIKSKTRVIISNHITNIDHLAVDLVLPCIVPGVWDLPKFLNWGLGFHDFGVKQGRDVLIENVKMHLNSSDGPIPLLCYPEGATTNGRAGLLKFGSWLFTLDCQMQPIYISVWRPTPIKASVSVLGSRWWSDLFWFLVLPFTVFTIKYLPNVKKTENESPEEFAKRVQQMMATAMSVCPTNYTDADKVELAKRFFTEQSNSISQSRERQRVRTQTSAPNTTVSSVVTAVRSRGSAQLEEMARKVKEVLPQVPNSVILKDIKVTTNIDETISRLLDGTVSYVAEQLSQTKTAQSTVAETSSKSSYLSTESSKPFYCGSKTFGKNANERSQSYAERKEVLIQAARRRYLEKHGLLKTENTGKNELI